jgi:hypothetical protein
MEGNNMKTKLTFHIDAGHGWLEVPIADLRTLGIAEKISTYSYQKNEVAYLEEDCDATLFCDKAEGLGFHLEISEVYDGDQSKIRRFDHYQASVI